MTPPSGAKEAREQIEAAAYWAMRLEAPSCRPADRAAFEAWRLENAEHARAFAQAQSALGTLNQHLTRTELIELGERVFEETRAPRKPWLRRTTVGLTAGCVLTAGTVLYRQIAPEPHRDAAREVAVSTFETAVGERSTVKLSDSSTITLNTDSLVSVHFTERSDTRRLTLERGEAHFQVEKDPRRFEVVAGDRRIVALGTAFDVRFIPDQDRVLVTLVEGRVSVDELIEGGATLGGPTRVPSENVSRTQLEPGEQLVVKPNEPPTVIEADLERVAGWREGRLVFRDDALPDAVAEINRYSQHKLIVADDARLEAVRISGVFIAGSTKSFIEAIETIHPVEARRIAYDRIELLWLGKGAAVAQSDA